MEIEPFLLAAGAIDNPRLSLSLILNVSRSSSSRKNRSMVIRNLLLGIRRILVSTFQVAFVFSIFAGVLQLIGCTAPSGSIPVEQAGIYAQIDTRLANKTINALAKGGVEERRTAIEMVRKNPENYAPPVLYQLAQVLFSGGEKDEGAFWFYAGQLRARFDANRCADMSAKQAVAVLNQKFGAPINEYAFKDIPKLEALIPRVVEWDRSTVHHYDHRWINLHGMDAISSKMGQPVAAGELSVSSDQWESIENKTRAEYLNGFRQAMLQLNKREN